MRAPRSDFDSQRLSSLGVVKSLELIGSGPVVLQPQKVGIK
jgi:hypothetical protein